MSRHLDSSTTTQMAKIMVQYGRSSRSSWSKSFWSSFDRTVMGKVIWENPIEIRLGEDFQQGMLIRKPWKRIVLICVYGWHQRSWFGRTNIILWSCTTGLYSKTVCNKQRYCWQWQNHVWILNFRRSNWKFTILGKSSNLFVVIWHGRSCQEIRGTIIRVGKQNNSTVSTPCIDDHHFKEEELKSVGELSKVCSQIVLKYFYLSRIGRSDILWSGNKLARSITKWTKICDKRLSRLISYVHHTCEYKQYCRVGNTAKQCRLGLFQDSDFAGDLEYSKSTSDETCAFSEVKHLFQSVGCVRNKLQFRTVQQNQKSFLWTQD